jgi:hypothetical protein
LAQFIVPEFSSAPVPPETQSSETFDYIGFFAVGTVGIA